VPFGKHSLDGGETRAGLYSFTTSAPRVPTAPVPFSESSLQVPDIFLKTAIILMRPAVDDVEAGSTFFSDMAQATSKARRAIPCQPYRLQ